MGRKLKIEVILTVVYKGVAESEPPTPGTFDIDTGAIVLENNWDEGEGTYYYEMIMPSGTVVPIVYDPEKDHYRIKKDDET